MTDEQAQALRRADLDPDPVRQFARWFGEAATTVRVPEAMALATADADGVPSVRMVLMKGFEERGLVFHTHYSSRKGRELAAKRGSSSGSSLSEGAAEPVEASVPGRAHVHHPRHGVAERLGRHLVTRLTPGAGRAQKSGVCERRELLGDGLPRHRQSRGQL